MTILSLLLIALFGGEGRTSPEAVTLDVPLVTRNSFQSLFWSSTWQENELQGLDRGAGHGRVSESVNLPIPPALWVGAATHGRSDPDYGAQDLALDVLLGWALGEEVDLSPVVFGMEVIVLTDFSSGSYGMALSRSF